MTAGTNSKKAFDDCKAFLHYMDSGKGYDLCEPYCVEGGAAFECQCDTLKDMTTVEEYADWVEGLVKGPMPGPKIDLHSVSMCEETKTATYVATFHGRHSGEGGPVPPTLKEMHTDYVYLVTLNNDDKVESVKKIWNDTWALKQVGWA